MNRIVVGVLAGLAALATSVPARAQQGLAGQWNCQVLMASANNRTERAFTMVLSPNQAYQAQGTQFRTLIGISENFVSQGEWALSQDSQGPYIRMLGQARFSYDGRTEQFIMVSHIQSANMIADQWSDMNGQAQVQCAR